MVRTTIGEAFESDFVLATLVDTLGESQMSQQQQQQTRASQVPQGMYLHTAVLPRCGIPLI